MAAISPIVIADGQGTPVNHTFAPAKTSADFALLEDRVAGIYLGYNKLTMRLNRPQGPSNTANRNLKLSILIETPKLEVVSNNTVSGIAPAPQVSYRPSLEMVYTFPERCALQDRKDLLAYAKNLLAKAEITAAVENYELPY